MKNKPLTDKIVRRLSSCSPVLEGKSDLVSRVMEATGEVKRRSGMIVVGEMLFGWSRITWARRIAAAASVAVITLFATQQYIMVERIGRLESRMVNISSEQIVSRQGEKTVLNSYGGQEGDFNPVTDSVTVSGRDLRELVDSYLDLQAEYEKLLKRYRAGNPGNKSNL